MGLSLRGQTSGAIDINAPNVAGNNTITLPGSNGAANQFYKNSGTAGTLTHSSMIEESNGDIKIGTTNNITFGSRRALTVANGVTGAVISLYNNTTATANPRISSNPSGSEINDIGIHAASTNGSIIAYTNNDTEALRITSAGLVGVGDDDPDVPFNVKAGGSSFAGQNTHVKIEDTTSLAANTGGLLAFEGVYNSSGNPGAFAMIHGGKDNADDGNYAGYLRFFTRANGSLPAERLRIGSTGRISIGNATNNANPTALLGVIADDGEAADLYVGKFHNLEATAGQSYGVDIRAGSNSTDHGFRVKNRANDTTQFLVRGDGKIGINATSPDVTLDVRDAQAELQVKSTTGTNSAGFRMIPGGQTNALYMYADGSRNINFDDHATSMISIRAGGGGITFNGDTAAANALDDYEEGTWTPTIRENGNGTAWDTISANTGSYTKIGDCVTFSGTLNYSGVATNVNSGFFSWLAGFPFSSSSSKKSGQFFISFLYSGVRTAVYSGMFIHGNSYAGIYKNQDATSPGTMMANEYPTGAHTVQFQGHYYV